MNIKELADATGVSIATVSNVLNNKGRVSDKTRNKILKFVNEVGFEINIAARELKLQKTNTIGLFLDIIEGPYYAELIRGIQDVIIKKDYSFIIIPNNKSQSKVTANLFERRVDGAIIFSPEMNRDNFEAALNSKIPIVFIDREIFDSDNICSVLLDNNSGIIEAIQYLKNINCMKVGFLSGVAEHYDSKERIQSFYNGIKIYDLTTESKWIFEGDFTEEAGFDAALKLAEYPKLPDAILCANDQMAIGMISGFNSINIKVPEDISIIGFDNIKLTKYFNPKLTTIDSPKYQLGQLAATTLFRGIEGEKITGTIKLPTKLIIRDSCKLNILR